MENIAATPTNLSGERRLQLALLEDAIYTLQCEYTEQPAEDIADLRDWVRSRDKHFGSFEFICEALGVDAGGLRETLLERKKRKKRVVRTLSPILC